KRISKKQQNISVEELSQALELTHKDIKEDKDILKGIVNFGNIDVKEIMKPRVDVIAADVKYGFKKMLSIIIESGYSRIPVYKDTLDNIKGVLYIKDLLPYLEEDNDFRWKDKIRNAYFVPENMKIDNLLEEFRQKKIHLSIVTDEYGGVLGIATLEDVLEEIVGEISDEYGEEKDLYNKIDETTFIFDGKIQLNDFFKVTLIKDDVFDDVRGGADSLAGLILEIQKEIPEKGDVIKYNNYTFVIDSADNRKIKKIKFKIQNKTS
ncbi:MAG: CBS domain-containing protein, partial [bacterium]|nr:CBS domain-containing protein [bacterium]